MNRPPVTNIETVELVGEEDGAMVGSSPIGDKEGDELGSGAIGAGAIEGELTGYSFAVGGACEGTAAEGKLGEVGFVFVVTELFRSSFTAKEAPTPTKIIAPTRRAVLSTITILSHLGASVIQRGRHPSPLLVVLNVLSSFFDLLD